MRYVLGLGLVLFAVSGQAGEWEASGGAGFGMYHPLSYSTAAGSAEAGIGPRYALNAAIGRQFAGRFAAEAVYTFQDGDFEISSGGSKTAYDANTHATHGDVLVYFGRWKGFRPYVAAGAGVKFYRGLEQPGVRPLGEFGSFRRATDTRPLLLFGGGVEWALSSHFGLRLDARDYTTPFPASVIVPAGGAHVSGWLHDFVPVLSITVR